MTISKQTLRTQALAVRQKISRDEANAASLMLAAHILDAVPVSARIVAGYRAMRGEIDVAGAFPELAERGYTLCLPVVETQDAPLIFRAWQPGEPLEKGAHGTEVPLSDAKHVMPDLIIVPLAAFDGRGNRLGYGAGYYDRTIAALRAQKKDVRIIGAAYSFQRVDHIPADSHDEKLDAVVTEKGLVTFT